MFRWAPEDGNPPDLFGDWHLLPNTRPLPGPMGAVHPQCVPASRTLSPGSTRGARGAQFAECAIESWKEIKWLDVPRLIP
jgi:hypothetical protein